MMAGQVVLGCYCRGNGDRIQIIVSKMGLMERLMVFTTKKSEAPMGGTVEAA
jgi:hypothetical protein